MFWKGWYFGELPHLKTRENDMVDFKRKFQGCMVGSALGDAIGELAFQYRDKNILHRKIDKLAKFIYTDDTAMSISLAESIINKGVLDPRELGERFIASFNEEPWRGYGPGPPTIFSMVERSGMSCPQAAQTLFGGQGSFGNGAAMRIAPVGLFYHDESALYEKACASAVLTHAHPVGQDGAAVQAKAVALSVPLNPEEPFPKEIFLAKLTEFAKTPEMRDKLQEVQRLLTRKVSPPKAAAVLGRSVVVQESLPFALFSFLRHPESFEDCLFCAVLNGGDRDTLGAMACAVSGAYLGIDSIPRSWREKLENKIHIQNLALELSKIRQNNRE